jgi:hypothetical protein
MIESWSSKKFENTDINIIKSGKNNLYIILLKRLANDS